MRKDARLKWAMGGLVGILGLTLVGLMGMDYVENSKSAVGREIAQAVGTGTIDRIDLDRCTRFDWDRMLVFGPYTAKAAMEKALGGRWNDVSRTTVDQSEEVNLVVFVKGRNVVHWFEHPRAKGDFAVDWGHGEFTKGDARLRIVRTGSKVILGRD